LLTVVVAAVLGAEQVTRRKTFGVCVAMAGVASALLAGLSTAPPNAWRGDLLMICAALCMAFYSVWSRTIIRRSGAISFTTMSMGIGALALTLFASMRGSFEPVASLDARQWSALGFLGLFGGALTFYLWSLALERTTPTRVAISITVNPIAAAMVGALLLDEPLRWNLCVGIVAVFSGIWLAKPPEHRPVSEMP